MFSIPVDLHHCVQIILLDWNHLYLRSRLLITTIPSSMYAYSEDGVNETLQAAAAIITDSMNKLGTDGVHVRDVANNGEVPETKFI